MKYRLLALDIDGTLIGTREQVAQDVVAALAAADRAGLRICLATGRSYAETGPIWRQLTFGREPEPLVLVSGALVTEAQTGRTLYQRTIRRELACEFADALTAAGYCAVAAVDPWRHGVDFFRTGGNEPQASARGQTPGTSFELTQRWLARRSVKVHAAARMADHANMPDPLRVSTILDRPRPDLLAELQRRFEPRMTMQTIYVPAYDMTILEAFSAGTSKHSALTYVAQASRLGKGQIAAVGDDMNDLAMIQGAGLGVAMPNSPKPLLDAAGHVATEGLAAFVTDLAAGKYD
jgi:Cof subfamily protein (haloacid dehalogenase superfamily)